ncbi:bifunctional adenosylcobinamide kinase/adenosylcobinamide-phosphate guanylyltransferase [Granulicatella sp. zg-ZJ]|uniref:bifunctional adenosylcobinamide kinase/adenosylcobinamide-phosphate guanylyltransferase n=1 Tax=unclassified Granulicatella TaxID=2630493 RepID=UPI0013C1DF4C|nr:MULTISPECIES: bifunctional adenosylcobinamide kinase/adenosylcobinamide-phosphate guanylyltransferase [unclassified Granulicatella]NEW61824.1 bifunctional adenosylcobinamide kinase/adenosylcobinamide-phosphate guanylyltransferase [Granulicatella sp. zg-ZJ]NEW65898.1 bifunctional adenosylcobinamide kinase/adenosylcobinamide-phosphate guanylyltransferase [Granulicatella sp. zg-84]QMI85127.1 bifunctional adenosylcobinamide kinase/adenosylcobinamide-phosphate guanylyltransferase [Carnobacteriacea
MGKIVLVTGGARSGKSSFTEEQLWDKDNVCYIATGVMKQPDAEWQERVRLHQERRPKSWGNHEQYDHIGAWIQTQSYDYYLLDCATMLTTNVLFDTVETLFPEKIMMEDTNFLTKEQQSIVTAHIQKEWQAVMDAVREKDTTMYIVTNEIGLGIVPDTALGRYFRDVLGNINQHLAKEASEVYLVICGLSQRLK